jgi:hypothetical protein
MTDTVPQHKPEVTKPKPVTTWAFLLALLVAAFLAVVLLPIASACRATRAFASATC